MNKRMIIMLIACTVVFGGVFGMKAMGKKGMNAYFDSMPVPAQTIASGEAQNMNWPDEVLSVGSLASINGTELTAETDGVVEAIHLSSGARVKKGDLLISLEASQARAEYVRLQAQAELAQLNLKRREDLYRSRSVSKSEVDAADAEARAAKAAADAQQVRLEKHNIVAPFDGVLGIRRVSLGQYVSKGTELITLQSLDPMEIEFAIAERDLSRMRVGQQTRIAVDGYNDVFTGQINAIEPKVDPSTRMIRMRAQVPNPDEKLRSGMFARVTVVVGNERPVIVVPRTAIKYDPYGESVFLVQDAPPAEEGKTPLAEHVASHRFVRTGEARGDFVEILEGVAAGDEVVVTGLLKLRNGQPIKINNELTPSASLSAPASDS